MNSDILGIFYIVTGIYKEYFNDFINTIQYIFPGYTKKLILISDGLDEYNNMYINDVNICVENFINYPYPFINTNKLQIVEYYANKHNINNIIYFDSDTYFIPNKEKSFYDDLVKKSNEKFVSLIPPYFIKFTFRDFIYVMNNFSLFGENNKFHDFKFFYNGENYDTIDTSYKWIQTSFFMCSKSILHNLNEILIDLISYNIRVMGCKLNYSDEFYINLLNVKYNSDLFFADFYGQDKDENNKFDTVFFYQKIKNIDIKQSLKYGNLNKNFRMFLLNNDDNISENDIYKFFINHRKNFLLSSYGYNIHAKQLFFDFLYLDFTYFDGQENIILHKDLYSNRFIQLYDENELCIGFVNKINIFSDNFNYDKFYDENYDYIEGRSFNDLKEMNFYDIDMCCFSKRYIEAYFNDNINFEPKIYKI